MKTSAIPLLIALILGMLSSASFSQDTVDDSPMRRDTAARIARDHQVSLDWKKRLYLI